MRLFLSLFFLAAFNAGAQITFVHGTLDEALKLAQKEKKPVFVDVYAVWCGPCKFMSNNVFTQKEVGEFYNGNFISVKIDGEKNDGPSVMGRYGITAFPTLLFLKPDGTLMARNVGALDAEKFLRKGREALDPSASPVYQAMRKYHFSSKMRDDMKAYLQVMLAEASDSTDYYSDIYFKRFHDLDLQDNVDFNVFYMREQDLYSPLTADFLQHPERTEARAYIGKLSTFLQASFSNAVTMRDFAALEKDVRYLYPYLSKASPQNGDVESYVGYVKGEYEKAVAAQ
jgi:thiol-disulfide isomerase/thioredoxin